MKTASVLPERLDAVTFKGKSGQWVGVFLDHYLMAQAPTPEKLLSEMRRVLTGYIIVSIENGEVPFQKMRSAPDRYRKMMPLGTRPRVTMLYNPQVELKGAASGLEARPEGETTLGFYELQEAA